MNKKLFLVFVLLIMGTGIISAQTVSVDSNFLSPDTNTSDIPEFISKFYEFSLAISGILAVGMILAGSVLYSTSGGFPQKSKDAKDMITSALWGIGLLFGSYLILKSINPQLVELRAPGTGLTGTDSLPALLPTNCSSTTPYMRVSTSTGAITPDGTLSSNSTGKDLKCTGSIPAIDPNTGFCQCYREEADNTKCAGVYEPKPVSNPYPTYSWTTDSTIEENSAATSDDFDGCPRKVSIPALPFKTIDCDFHECATDWTRDSDTHKNKDDDGNLTDTVGWVWPYYPKERPSTDNKSNAMCVLYAYLDTKSGEIKRADLDGLKPCTEFDAGTTPNYSLRYGGGTPITEDLASPKYWPTIENPDVQTKESAMELLQYTQSNPSKVVLSDNASCHPNSSVKNILTTVSNGNYPSVCASGCSAMPNISCPNGGPNHNVSLSVNLLSGLNYLSQRVGQAVRVNNKNVTVPPFVITSLTGGDHSANSLHYSGRAADIAINDTNIQTWKNMVSIIRMHPSTQKVMCEYLDSSGNTLYSCDGLYGDGSRNQHIHIEYKMFLNETPFL